MTEKNRCFAATVILALAAAGPASAAFVETSETAGLSNEARGNWGAPMWGDLNDDGFLDLIVPIHREIPFIYRNNGDGTFASILESSGIVPAENDSLDWHGFSLGDYDKDGHLDLFITTGAHTGDVLGIKADSLWKGDGAGVFTNVTASAGTENAFGRGRSGCWADYDNDGALDLFVKNFDTANVLYHNDGDGSFTDRADEAGLAPVTDGAICSWADYDNDGDPDLFFTGMGSVDRLFNNGGDGVFSEVTAAAGIPNREFGRGIAWGDYNNDGLPDLFVARGHGATGVGTGPEFRNSLYRNNGDGTFTDVSDAAGMVEEDNTWSGVWGDYDNDGDLDLYVSTAGGDSGSGNANRLYRNNGDGTFTEVAAIEQIDLEDGVSRHLAAAWGDYDNDGFLDLVIKNGVGDPLVGGRGTHELHRNLGNGNHFLKVRLRGVQSNGTGIGAKVSLTTDQGSQFREYDGGGGGQLYSQGDGPVHFGLGGATTAHLRVEWPSGEIDVLCSVQADQTLEVQEGSASDLPCPEDATPPVWPGPVVLSADAIGVFQIDLSWIAATDETQVTEYLVYRDGEWMGTTPGLGFVDAGRSPGTQYCYQVIAVDGSGNASDPSNVACAFTTDETPPAWPAATVLNAVAAGGFQVHLDWTPAEDDVGIDGYLIYRGGVQAGGSAVAAFSDSNLTPDTEYCYTVTALDVAGNESAASNAACAVTDDTPPVWPVPAPLATSAEGASVIGLGWTAAEDNIAVVKYEVYRDGLRIASTGFLSYTDRNLAAPSTHCYFIKAVDGAGNLSVASNQSCSTTAGDNAPPAPPPGLTATAAGSFEIRLAWGVPTDDVGVSAYRVFRGSAAVASPATTTYRDSGLNVDTSYCYRVTALDPSGNESEPSHSVCASTADMTPPQPPAGLSAGDLSTGSASFGWNASTDDVAVTGYRVYRGTDLLGQSSQTSWTDDTVIPGESYSYSVTALDAAGNESAPSGVLHVTIPVQHDPEPAEEPPQGDSPTSGPGGQEPGADPSDGDAADGETGSGDGRTGCFIATAAFGSPMEPQVQLLREVRDRQLKAFDWGRAFIEFYYSHSPPVADLIAGHEVLRIVVRGLLWPIVGFSWLSLAAGGGLKVLLLVFLVVVFMLQGTHRPAGQSVLKHRLGRFLTAVAAFAVLSGGLQARAESIAGLYALVPGNQRVPPAGLKSPYISGIAVRSNWKVIEPSDGRFQWNYFEEAVAEAAGNGKKVMMSVLPGIMTPEWVYEEGAGRFTFVNPNPRAEGRTDSIPLPWNEVFLAQWTAFIRAMGEKFNGEPAVVLVTMSGGAVNSVEMHLPKGRGAELKFMEAGYTKEKLVDSWKRIIDAYAEAFPEKSLALPVAVPVRRDGALEEIIDYAVGKLGSRLYLASGSLSDRTFPDSPLLSLVRRYSDRAGVGFQMLSPATAGRNHEGSEGEFQRPAERKRRGGREARRPREPIHDLRRAFEIGLAAGASYFQVYQSDVVNPEFEGDIRFAAEQLAGRLNPTDDRPVP